MACLPVVLCAALACSPAASESPETQSPKPDPVPAIPFDLATLSGERVQLEEFRGRILLLDFWATWCPPCVIEIPELNAFYASERDRGVALLAISVDEEDRETIDAWVREKGVEYPVALGSESLARRYGAHAYPFHVLVGPEGHVLEVLEPGFHSAAELIAIVDRHRSS